VIFVHDPNLGFPFEDPVWVKFFQRFSIEPKSSLDPQEYHETAIASFLPAGMYYYLREQNTFEPIGSALFRATGTTENTTLLITRGIDTLAELKGKKVGYPHRYCTSSYFALAILLMRHGHSIYRFFSQLVEVDPWEGQIEAVSSGRVDTTMVQQDIWRQNAQQTKWIEKVDHIPSPIFITRKDADISFKQELTHLLLSHQPQKGLFSGFISYREEQLKTFFEQARKAIG